jgi:hypothetical protein
MTQDGAYEDGAVPAAYGKFRFPKDWMARYLATEQDPGHEILAEFFREQPPMALVLEYAEGTKSLHDLGARASDEFVKEVLRRYKRIHQAGVYQSVHDVRNILVTKQGWPIIVSHSFHQ